MKAIVTGSFDPITLGHIHLVMKACEQFEQVFVVALNNETKEYMFNLDERKKLIEVSLKGVNNVIVDAYDGYTSDYMHKYDINYIVRGIRNETDREYEKKLAEIMKTFDENFETVFYDCSDEYKDLSSTLVKERIKKNLQLDGFLHPDAVLLIEKKKKCF